MVCGNNYLPLLFARVASLLCKYAHQIMKECTGEEWLKEFALIKVFYILFFVIFFVLDLMIFDLATMASAALL